MIDYRYYLTKEEIVLLHKLEMKHIEANQDNPNKLWLLEDILIDKLSKKLSKITAKYDELMDNNYGCYTGRDKELIKQIEIVLQREYTEKVKYIHPFAVDKTIDNLKDSTRPSSIMFREALKKRLHLYDNRDKLLKNVERLHLLLENKKHLTGNENIELQGRMLAVKSYYNLYNTLKKYEKYLGPTYKMQLSVLEECICEDIRLNNNKEENNKVLTKSKDN